MTISGAFSSFGTGNTLQIKNNNQQLLSSSPNLSGNSILSNSFSGSSSFQSSSNFLTTTVNSTVITESFKLLDNPW
ncbi:hypothetical protein RB653_010044 [Dictyostelium firmibasis]|uniref:Uncharacterized protein n=1 Tax=Dictyostelium firmibasis TaxID=79012 RepID=A0AAN7YP82_9MYCE